VYREWSSVAIGGDESDEEDGMEDGDGEPHNIAVIQSVDVTTSMVSGGLQIPRTSPESLGESFGGLSISPAQPKSIIVAS